MSLEHILKLSAEELYQKALEFLLVPDYNNYAIYMTMAANYGYRPAEENLFHDYQHNGNCEKQDPSLTVAFYQATRDYSYSLNYLGYMYESGLQFTKNMEEAVRLYQLAVAKDNPLAYHNLAFHYHDGSGGLQQDFKKAIELWEIAISKGYYDSCAWLGRMYRNGTGVQEDYQRAKELFELAMTNGYSSGVYGLASLYDYGLGVEMDLQRAEKLYKEAIMSGYRGPVLKDLIKLYKNSDLGANRAEIVAFFVQIEESKRLKEIYEWNDETTEVIIENYSLKQRVVQLEKENAELKAHIRASPDGELYFEAMKEYHTVKSKN